MSASDLASPRVLTINSGSSSIKFAVYQPGDPPRRVLSGKIDRIGLADPTLSVTLPEEKTQTTAIAAPDHRKAIGNAIEWLRQRTPFGEVDAIGHRVVHGGPKYSRPERVTPELVEELRRISALAPEHLPSAISLIEEFLARFPDVQQLACFDTAFHREMPRVAKMLAIPRRFEKDGMQRYGFHGLSYQFLMEELARLAGPETARGRVVLAHFGNGASLAAVRDGKSIDTSMGFTPAAGIPMGRRTGDIDPGIVAYLARVANMTPEQFHRMANHESGLLGVSEISSDMRDLLEREQSDVRAAEAVNLFCYQAKKWIGAFAAALGGLDTLIFSGGIGENAAVVRARACDGLQFLGVELDDSRNAVNAPLISRDAGRVSVRVIPTDEELVIAQGGVPGRHMKCGSPEKYFARDVSTRTPIAGFCPNTRLSSQVVTRVENSVGSAVRTAYREAVRTADPTFYPSRVRRGSTELAEVSRATDLG